MNKNINNLSASAHGIFYEVLHAMQNSEEIGGTDSTKDYINLMSVIIAECNQRIQTVLTHSEV